MIDHALKNTGFIKDVPQQSDLFFGRNGRVVHTITNEKAWLPYLSKGELQIGTYYDTGGCTSFSALNIVEAHFNYLIRNGQIESQNLDWLHKNGYINAAGDVEFSDRFTVKMSGTDPMLGNTPAKVWWSIRNHGLVPESYWSWKLNRDVEQEEKYVEWFYQPIPVHLKNLGQEFREMFEIMYEKVQINISKTELMAALKHSPAQVAISTNCPVVRGIQERCDDAIGHALALIKELVLPDRYYPLFDQYINNEEAIGQARFIRKVSEDYIFYYFGYICTVIEKTMDNSFVKILKDRNGKAVGYFVPCTSPAAFESMAAAFGKTIIKKSPTEIDWDKNIEGTFELKPETNV